MSNATQQVKERSSPSEYILVTLQQPCKDACVKRTGLLVGFGGREDQMIGLEVGGILNFHDSKVYAITKIEWNFGRKNKIKFFEPNATHPQVDNHVKSEALKLAKKLFSNITMKLGLGSGYFHANRLYKNPPKHTSEEITEPKLTKVEKKTTKTTPSSTYPDGGGSLAGNRQPVRTYVPPAAAPSTTVTTVYKKEGPTMFRRTSTELVKARVAAIAERLEELALLTAETVVEEKVVQLKDQVKKVREEIENAKVYSPFCEDCKKKNSCIGEVARVYYCSNKIPEEA